MTAKIRIEEASVATYDVRDIGAAARADLGFELTAGAVNMGKTYCGPQGPQWCGLLSRGADEEALLPYASARRLLTHTGRTAIALAAEILGLNESSEVLLPAYNCGVEIDPYLQSGARVRLYRVDRACRLDADDLRRRITPATRAVHVTHYWGFPQDLSPAIAACREHRLALIEDCALALLSRGDGRPLGSLGDLSVFCLSKTLPIPDGGALVINNPALPDPPALRKPGREFIRMKLPRLAALGLLATLARTPLGGPIGRAAFAWKLRRAGLPPTPDGRPPLPACIRFSEQFARRRITRLSRRLAGAARPADIVERRRRNYAALMEALGPTERIRPIFPVLPGGCCPLVVPLLAEDRERVHRGLLAAGIVSTRWWARYHPAMAWEEQPDAVYLKNHVITLPVHQALDGCHMRHMAAVLRKIDRD